MWGTPITHVKLFFYKKFNLRRLFLYIHLMGKVVKIVILIVVAHGFTCLIGVRLFLELFSIMIWVAILTLHFHLYGKTFCSIHLFNFQCLLIEDILCYLHP